MNTYASMMAFFGAWDEPARSTPLADVLAMREMAREDSVPLDRQELGPEGQEYEWWYRLKPAGWRYDPATMGFFHPAHRGGDPVSLGEAISLQREIDYHEG